MSGASRVHDATEAKQVGTRIYGFTASLLGRHILWRARNGAAACHGGFINNASQAEVGHHGAVDATGQQDVGRLHIAVHDSRCVGCRQTFRDLHADTGNFASRQRSQFLDALL